MNQIPDEIRQVWSDSNEEEYVMKMDQIRRKSVSLAKTAKWRNVREYAGAVVVIAMFSYYVYISDVLLIKIGSMCTIAAAFYIMLQMNKRSSSTSANPGSEPIISFHRKQLETERDALRSVWAWYVLPTVPGFILFTVGLFQSRPDANFTRYFAVTLLIYIFVLLYNAWGARQLQKEIDALPSV